MFFPSQIPLNVVHNINRFLDVESRKALTLVNHSWGDFPFMENDPPFVSIEGDVPVADLIPHLTKVISHKVDSVSIKRLTAGYSPWASSYKVETGKECFVMRHIKKCESKPHEILASLFFSSMGIAPRVEYFNIGEGIIIMQYIENTPNFHRDISSELLEDIAKKLRIIHLGPKLKRPDSVDRSTLIDLRRNDFKRISEKFPECELLGGALEKLDRLASLIKQTTFCHNDLNPNNLLASGDNITFIDWELSGVNDPLLDVATVAAIFRLNSSQSEKLFRDYLKEGPEISCTEELVEHFECMKLLALYRFAVSFGAHLKVSEDVRKIDIDSIPKFSEYHRDRDGVIDKTSDVGQFTICVMLLKEAGDKLNQRQIRQIGHESI